MPKFGIHFVVLEKVLARLRAQNSSAENQELGEIIRQNRFAANLGCIGPDLLFWAPDYDIVQGLRGFVDAYAKIMEAYEALEETVETIKETIVDPIVEPIEEVAESIVDALEQVPVLGDAIVFLEDVHEKIEAIKESFSAIAGGMKDEIAQSIFVRVLGLDSASGSEGNTLARSLFHGLFQSKMQAGWEEMDWYWFEMLHYRKTGDFAKALIRKAESDEKYGGDAARAYAYGYATHYTADLVGHPFVNTISGSPYRMNVQRHVVIENFMDQWKWGDHFPEESIRNTLFSRLGFEDVDELPDNLADLIADTLQEVYGDVVHPLRFINDDNTAALADADGVNPLRDGFLEPEDIKTAYQFQRIMLKFLGGQEGKLKPEEPFEGADTYLSDLMSGGGLDIPPAPAAPSTSLPSNLDEFFAGIAAWFEAAQAYVEWAIDAVVAVVDAIADALSNFLEDPVEELLKLILALAYAAQCLLYDAYRMIHQVLALAGLAYPEPDDAALSSEVAEALITTRHIRYKTFPILKTPGQPHLDTRSYASVMKHRNDGRFTSRPAEKPHTTPSFSTTRRDSTPDSFIDRIPLNVQLLERYAKATKPEETRQLAIEREEHFGNAVDLSLFILSNKDDEGQDALTFCNWNLDGDRGYGYKCWDGIPFTVLPGEMDGAIDRHEDLNEVLVQDFSVWTDVEQLVDGAGVQQSHYVPEIYVNDKTFAQTLLAALDISEDHVPPIYRRADRMRDTPIERWLSLVPQRFQIHTGTTFNNFFFCNGATSTPSSSMRCTVALQKVLNGAFRGITERRFNIKLIHNYTSADMGDLCGLFDVAQSVLGDYLSSMQTRDAIVAGTAIPDVTNPTQVAVMALLHHGMDRDIPLVLSGHSQGGIITANAVMAFSTLGQRHRDYLSKKVKLFHMEPELLIKVRKRLRLLVKSYLVYIMNDSDPLGSDLLMEAGSGDVPLIPDESGIILPHGQEMTDLAAAIANPDPFNIDFYRALQSAANSGAQDLTALVSYFSRINMEAHYMPVQFGIIREDIRSNRFRTDPGALPVEDRLGQMSTGNALHPSSVNVREFLTTP